MQIQSWKQLNELQPKCSELYQALESSAHLPVSTASAERSFSTMGRLKTYLTKYDDLQKTDWTCSHEYSHRFGNRQRRSTKTIKMQLAGGQCVLAVTHYLRACVCECACVSLAFYLSPLNNVTYKHIGLAETNKQTTRWTTKEATRISGPMNRRDSCSINCCCWW